MKDVFNTQRINNFLWINSICRFDQILLPIVNKHIIPKEIRRILCNAGRTGDWLPDIGSKNRSNTISSFKGRFDMWNTNYIYLCVWFRRHYSSIFYANYIFLNNESGYLDHEYYSAILSITWYALAFIAK